jgi:hypothetical protein
VIGQNFGVIVSVRTGSYNLCDPREKQDACDVALYGDHDCPVSRCSMFWDEGQCPCDGYCPEDALDAMLERGKEYIYTGNLRDVKTMSDWYWQNCEAVHQAWKNAKITRLQEQAAEASLEARRMMRAEGDSA